MTIELWTDGSGLATGGPGGWAYVLRAIDDLGLVVREREGSGGIPGPDCTNNRAELTAVIEGLRALERPCGLTVASDSEYVVAAFTDGWLDRWRANGWRNRDGAPVANRDLWVTLHVAASLHLIDWRLVKGHAKTLSCRTCGWTTDVVAGKRVKTCPVCRMHTPLLKRDKYPLNARCDALAGEARRALITTREAA